MWTSSIWNWSILENAAQFCFLTVSKWLDQERYCWLDIYLRYQRRSRKKATSRLEVNYWDNRASRSSKYCWNLLKWSQIYRGKLRQQLNIQCSQNLHWLWDLRGIDPWNCQLNVLGSFSCGGSSFFHYCQSVSDLDRRFLCPPRQHLHVGCDIVLGFDIQQYRGCELVVLPGSCLRLLLTHCTHLPRYQAYAWPKI